MFEFKSNTDCAILTKDKTFQGDLGNVVQLDVKALTEDGEIEGYASVYGNVDQGGDIVQNGAFADSLNSRPIEKIKMLWQHDSYSPIGYWTDVKSDNKGLFIKGRLLLSTQKGKEAYELIKVGAVDGLSIGYRTDEYEYDTSTHVRTITKAELWETSIVTFPMNAESTINAVKSATDIKTIRDFEKHLRDVGFSNNAAKSIAMNGFKQSDLRDEVDNNEATMRSLNQLTQLMKA